MKKICFFYLLLGIIMFTLCSCATVGKDFSGDSVSQIRIGKTTKADVRVIFGNPWRTGLEDGKETWTYGHYRYQLIGQDSTKDLVIRFDDTGVVTSYSFNKTAP
jgi:outer membrane protein assembly factor BamE (lipoprotein component of BamABCDE complex)